jgi:hypothetical protein
VRSKQNILENNGLKFLKSKPTPKLNLKKANQEAKAGFKKQKPS